MSVYALPLVITVVLGAALIVLMVVGWRRRGARQSEIPAPPAAVVLEPEVGPIDAVYVATTHAGQRLERVVAHGLGSRSRATVTVGRTADGARAVLVLREGAPSFTVPATDVEGVALSDGMIGKALGKNELTVLTWTDGSVRLDTGLHVRDNAARDELMTALGRLVPGGTATQGRES